MAKRQPEEPVLSFDCPEFIAAFRHYKEAGDWTNADLADALGVARVTIGEWLKGRFHPNVLYVRKLCQILGVRQDVFWKTGMDIVERERELLLQGGEADAIVEALMSLDPETRRAVRERLGDGDEPAGD